MYFNCTMLCCQSGERESENQQVSSQHRHGGALDWSKMDNMNNLFTVTQVSY